MNNANRLETRRNGSDIRQMIEPLVNYICATDQPKRALMSALAVLVHEIELTNRAAVSHFQTFSQN